MEARQVLVGEIRINLHCFLGDDLVIGRELGSGSA